jgi:hypothetical protein
MTDYVALLKRNITCGEYTNLENAMLIVSHFIIGDISSDSLASLLAEISWTYDSTAKTFSDGTTSYTINTLFNNCITTVYKTSYVLNKDRMKDTITFAKNSSYLTADEATALIALL